jgi:hypothetical protein
MDWEPGARGTVIAGRYRASGELRRRGMIEATDLEAPPQRAACRLIGVPGDPQAVDDWQRAWVDAEGAARLPSLRGVVRDADGTAWAVLDPARTDPGRALPADARGQAMAIGAALARAGLDPGDVTAAMLEVGEDGLLRVEGPVWLGGDLPPAVAGERLAMLLPVPVEPAWEPEPAPARRPPRAHRGRRHGVRRIAIAGLALACLAGAGLALALPTRSQELAPGPADAIVVAPEPDVLLGDVVQQEPAPASAPEPTVVAEPRPAPAPRTVTVVVTVEAPPAPAPADAAPVLPEPADAAPDLPLEGAGAPPLPVAGGW